MPLPCPWHKLVTGSLLNPTIGIPAAQSLCPEPLSFVGNASESCQLVVAELPGLWWCLLLCPPGPLLWAVCLPSQPAFCLSSSLLLHCVGCQQETLLEQGRPQCACVMLQRVACLRRCPGSELRVLCPSGQRTAQPVHKQRTLLCALSSYFAPRKVQRLAKITAVEDFCMTRS